MFGRTKELSYVAVPAEVTKRAASVFMSKCFVWMTAGLALTGVVAMATAASGLVYYMSQPIFFGLMIAELALVMWLSLRVEKMSAAVATGAFLGYSALNGITLSVILMLYSTGTIASAFFTASGMFAAMAVYGLVTKRDLTGVGSFMVMGLIGFIIASVVNIFLASSALAWALNYIGVIIFLGLTAWDAQKIKRIGETGIMEAGDEAIRKGAIMGALTLYLDFINLFLLMLRLVSGGRD